jgi:CubicO group peptidase (beta-lactamase class C family)
MSDKTLDEAFGAAIDELSQPQFGHLVGIGMAINGDMRLGGPAPDQVTNTFSVTKTVLAWAILEAVRLGVFSDLEEVITVAAPPECGATPRSLLWMAHSWHQEPDMDALEVLPHDPLPLIVSAMGGPSYGTGSYVNAGMHVMIRELQHRTGSAAAFVDQTVLAPAGIHDYLWEVDPLGVPWGFAHLHLSVHDLLRLGQHRLHDESIAPNEPPPSPAMPPECLPYAAGMWRGDGFLMAAGWGGQCMMLLPRADAVLVTLASTGWDRATNTDLLPDGWGSGRQLLERHVLPVLLAGSCAGDTTR